MIVDGWSIELVSQDGTRSFALAEDPADAVCGRAFYYGPFAHRRALRFLKALKEHKLEGRVVRARASLFLDLRRR